MSFAETTGLHVSALRVERKSGGSLRETVRARHVSYCSRTEQRLCPAVSADRR